MEVEFDFPRSWPFSDAQQAPEPGPLVEVRDIIENYGYYLQLMPEWLDGDSVRVLSFADIGIAVDNGLLAGNRRRIAVHYRWGVGGDSGPLIDLATWLLMHGAESMFDEMFLSPVIRRAKLIVAAPRRHGLRKKYQQLAQNWIAARTRYPQDLRELTDLSGTGILVFSRST